MGKGALGQLSAYWPEDTARHAHVPLKRVSEIALHAVAASASDRPALVTADGETSFGQLSARVKALAAALRTRVERGARVALALEDPLELATALFAGFEAEVLLYASAGPIEATTLEKFGADLVIGGGSGGAVPYAEVAALQAPASIERPDFKRPLLALALPDRSGEVVHNHKTLAAHAIAVGSFYMIEAGTRVLLLDPPTGWLSLGLMLGTWQRGGTIWAGWGARSAPAPERVDYLVASWDTATARFVDAPPRIPRVRIGAGAIIGVEGWFSVSRRRRMARRLQAPVLTVLGRSDLGPVLASHPTWFLDDAVGIPLPNVDTRPMNPADGAPLNIGWDAVESAELGFKTALAPAGGELAAEGWLRSRIIAEIDPTGLYFLSV